jgi:citrate synthase/citryl-CoA lyase
MVFKLRGNKMVDKWETKITQIKPNEINIRGYRVEDLMTNLTFTESIYLLFTGTLPETGVGKLLEAIFISSIDHGVTPPSAHATRTAVSTGAPYNAAVAAGLLSINDYHGGAIYNCMHILQNALDLVSEENDVDGVAKELVHDAIQARKRIAGFGHRIHKCDPRTRKLFSLAEEYGIGGKAVEMIKAFKVAMKEQGKNIPINVDGAIAALLIDLGLPHDLANAFFMIARVPGLFAHAFEEKTTQKPMRHIDTKNHVYAGNENIQIPERREG